MPVNPNDTELFDEVEQEEAKAGRFSMKRYFKTPEDANETPFMDYVQKKLKKAMAVNLQDSPFFLITNFRFADEPEAPFLYIGAPNTFWKQAIKDHYRRTNEFAMGTCSIEDKNGDKVLKLTVESGKGERETNLRQLNKITLKRLRMTAEFTDGQDSTLKTKKDGSEVLSIGKKELPTDGGAGVGKEGSVFNRIQQEIARFKNIPETDKKLRMEQAQLVLTLAQEFKLTYNGQSTDGQEEYVKKAVEFMQHALKHYNGQSVQSDVEEFIHEYKVEYLKDKQQLVAVERGIEQLKKDVLTLTGDKLAEAQDRLKKYTNYRKAEYAEQFQDLLVQKMAIEKWLADEENNPSPQDKNVLGALLREIAKEQEQLLKNQGSEFGEVFKDIANQTQLKSYADESYDKESIDKLAQTTALPPIKDASFFGNSALYKEIVEQHAAIGKIKNNAIDMRRVALLEMNELIVRWEKEFKLKKSPSSKELEEKAEVEKISAGLWKKIEDLAAFTAQRDDFPRIMELAREFDIKAADYRDYFIFENSDEYLGIDRLFAKEDDTFESSREELEMDLEKHISLLDGKITEWQRHYTNLSDFGTHKQNQALEFVRTKIRKFLEEQVKLKKMYMAQQSVGKLTGASDAKAQQELEDERKKLLAEHYKDPKNRQAQQDIRKDQAQNTQDQQKLEEERDQLKRDQWEHKASKVLPLQREIAELKEKGTAEDDPTLVQKQSELEKAWKDYQAFDDKIAAKEKELLKLNKAWEDLIKKQNDLEKLVYEALAVKAKEVSDKMMEQRRLAIIDLAKEYALKKSTDLAQQKQIARSYAAKLIEQQSFTFPPDIVQGIDAKLNANITYMEASSDLSKQLVQEQLDAEAKQDIAYDDPNAEANLRHEYDPNTDNEFKDLEKKLLAIQNIVFKAKSLLQLSSVSKQSAERKDKIEEWQIAMQVWMTKRNRYYPSEALNENAKKLEGWAKNVQDLEDQDDHIAALTEREKKIKHLLEANKTHLSKIAEIEVAERKLRAKSRKKPKDEQQLLEYRDLLTKHRNRLLDNSLLISAYKKEWEEHFGKITDPNLQNEKAETKKKLGDADTYSQNIIKDKFQNPTAQNAKKSLYEEISNSFKSLQPSISYKKGDEKNDRIKTAKLADIAVLEEKIKDWNAIAINPATKEEMAEQKKRVDEISSIWEVLALEKAKLNQDIVVRKDVLYDSISLISQKLPAAKDRSKITEEQILQAQHLVSLADYWLEQANAKEGDYPTKSGVVKSAKDAAKHLLGGFNARFFDLKKRLDQETQDLTERQETLEKDFKAQLDLFADGIAGLQGDEKDAFVKQKGYVEGLIAALRQKFENDLAAAKNQMPAGARDRGASKKMDEVEHSLHLLKRGYDKESRRIADENTLLFRGLERLATAALQGFDVYESLENIQMGTPEETKKKREFIQKVVLAAVQRARQVYAASQSSEQAREMIAHIPVGLWPDEFVEEMETWGKIDAMHTERLVEQGLETLSNLLKDAKGVVDGAMELGSAAYEVYESGKFTVEVKVNGEKKKFDCSLWDGGVANKQEQTTKSYGEQVKSSFGFGDDPFKAIKSVHGMLKDVTDQAKSTQEDMDKSGVPSLFAPKEGETEEQTRKRNVLMVKFASSATQKILSKATNFTDDSDAGKIAKAVLQSVNVLLSLFDKAMDGAEDEASFTERLKASLTSEGAEKAFDTLISVGAAVSDIVGIFVAPFNVVSAALNFVADIKTFIKSVIAAVRAFEAKHKVKATLDDAIEQDSYLRHPLKREYKSAKQRANSAAVDATAAGIQMIGSGVNVVGTGLMLAGEPEVVAAGAAVKAVAAGIKLTGKALKVGKDIYYTFAEEVNRSEIKELMKLAKAGDRKARLKIMEKSRFYAKACLAVRAADGDPLALRYCFESGITQKELDQNEDTAKVILKKLFELSGESDEERTIGERVKKSLEQAGNFFKKLFVGDAEKLDFSTSDTEALKRHLLAVTSYSYMIINLEEEFEGDARQARQEVKELVTQFSGELTEHETMLNTCIESNVEIIEAVLKDQASGKSTYDFSKDLEEVQRLQVRMAEMEKLLIAVRSTKKDLHKLLDV